MSVQNVLAGVAVKNLETSAEWYGKVIGVAGNRPMKEVFEWLLPSGGALQMFEDRKRAGASSITLSVKGLDQEVERISKSGVMLGKRTDNDKVSTVIIEDPDGNRVVLAEQHGHSLAK